MASGHFPPSTQGYPKETRAPRTGVLLHLLVAEVLHGQFRDPDASTSEENPSEAESLEPSKNTTSGEEGQRSDGASGSVIAHTSARRNSAAALFVVRPISYEPASNPR